MPGKTGINWTDETWNVFTGCSRITDECINCYAELLAGTDPKLVNSPRYKELTVIRGDGVPHWTGEVRFWPDALTHYIRKTAPVLVFTNSMSDPFHENVAREEVDLFFGAMLLGNQHVYQVLTKRPGRMANYINLPETRARVFGAARRIWNEHFHKPSAKRPAGHPFPENRCVWPLPHVWLGCSVGSQKSADRFIPELLQIPAGWLLWLSSEPLIGRVTLNPEWLDGTRPRMNFIQWIITGGESGARDRSRPMRPAWPAEIKEACDRAGIAYWEKQPGNWRELVGLERDLLLIDSPRVAELLETGDLCCLDKYERKVTGPRVVSELMSDDYTPLFMYNRSKHGESAFRAFPPFPETFARAGELSAGRPTLPAPVPAPDTEAETQPPTLFSMAG